MSKQEKIRDTRRDEVVLISQLIAKLDEVRWVNSASHDLHGLDKLQIEIQDFLFEKLWERQK